MKSLIVAIILSVIAILFGGFVFCFPQFIPFAITLITLGSVGFVVFGILAIAVKCNYFN